MEGGARWRDIAVACADPETYRPVLETVLRRAGIPAYFAGTRDLLREPVVRMLLAALGKRPRAAWSRRPFWRT